MPRRTRKSKYKDYTSKYEKDAMIYESIVTKIEVQNQEIGERIKNVFYVKSNVLPEGRMCILWGRTNFNVGDKLAMKGRMNNDGVFLVWSHMIHRNTEGEVYEVSSA